MGFFNGLIVGLFALGIAAMLFFTVKNKPEMFAAKKLNKSFFTMGILALILIGVVGVVVMLLRG